MMEMRTRLLVVAVVLVALLGPGPVRGRSPVPTFHPSEIDGQWEGHAGNCVKDRFARLVFYNSGSSFVSSTFLLASGTSTSHMGSVEVGERIGNSRKITLYLEEDGTFVAVRGLYRLADVLSAGKKLILGLNNPGDDFPLDITSAANHYDLFLKQ